MREYTYWKVLTDPVYAAAWNVLGAAKALPLLDLGCGMGLLAFYLRDHGFSGAIHGVDFDTRKIVAANRVRAPEDAETTFESRDFRDVRRGTRGHVTFLDVLLYVRADEQAALLERAASWVAPDGGVLIIRSGIRDDSWRYRITHTMDILARLIRWMKSPPVEYPTRELFERVLGSCGFRVEFRPLWGRTPFNNHLIVARRL